MAERTLILIKPDGVQRALVGTLVDRFERRGLRIAGLKLIHPDRALAERHYAVHLGKPFYAGLVQFIVSGPVVAIALEGENAVAIGRSVIGALRDPVPGSIRGDFALSVGQNLVHGSDEVGTAQNELALWFKPEELVDYKRDIDRWIE
jgi:nucleoside-diphosphate kinase